jgi:hypothetical protein
MELFPGHAADTTRSTNEDGLKAFVMRGSRISPYRILAVLLGTVLPIAVIVYLAVTV